MQMVANKGRWWEMKEDEEDEDEWRQMKEDGCRWRQLGKDEEE